MTRDDWERAWDLQRAWNRQASACLERIVVKVTPKDEKDIDTAEVMEKLLNRVINKAD